MSILLKKIFHGKKNFPLMFIIFLAAIVVGVVAVFYNEIFLYGTKLARERFFENTWTIFIITPSLFLISAWLCRKFAPNAAGGGPDHVISALEKLSSPEKHEEGVSEYLSFKILVVKIISSIICITGGGALGREGPVVQISASIFVMLGERMKKFLPSFDLRTWIVAGSAAGVAAAFNTPLAGIVFAIEELAQFHFEQKFSGFKTQAFFAVIVAGVTAQLITGSYVLFEFPIMHFGWGAATSITLLIISSGCGFFAWLLKIICNTTAKWRNSIQGPSWFIIPIFCGLIVAFVSYNIGIDTFGAGMFTIQGALKSSHPIITYQESIGRFINILATMSSGCAGGLLLPALALGAGVGSMGSTFLPMEDSRIFVSVGMAAFLGALINAPLTAAVLVLEVTNQRELVFPLFLSSLMASWIFKTCNHSYTRIKRVSVSVTRVIKY